jgi:preprotein translocase subunit SecA
MVLLNFVIALISQSYDDVMEKQMESDYLQKTKLTRECRFMMKTIGTTSEVRNMFILTTNSETGDNKVDEWQGFVQTVRNYLKT